MAAAGSNDLADLSRVSQTHMSWRAAVSTLPFEEPSRPGTATCTMPATNVYLSPPKVSIGLPVYNGEPYLRGALESLLAQDYPSLEFIISDNASTDGTFDLCCEFAERDARLRLYRNDTNIGSAANFNRVFELADGPYFTWAAHDDLMHPTYIAKCVRALEDNPGVVLCGCDINFIDETGAALDYPGEYNRLDTSEMTLRERVKSLTRMTNWYSLYGVARTSALRRTRLMTSALGCDVVLLMELLFQGQTKVLPERLFTYRLVLKSTERYMNEITGLPQNATHQAYTGLARALLHTIETSKFPIAVRTEMREDLLENVTDVNVAWRNMLIYENPDLERLPRYLLPVEMRRTLWGGLATEELAELRARAFECFISSLPLHKRVAHKVNRYMDRHVLWRFRAKS